MEQMSEEYSHLAFPELLMLLDDPMRQILIDQHNRRVAELNQLILDFLFGLERDDEE